MSEFFRNKVIKKATKIFLWSLLVFLLLCSTLYFLLISPYFQTRITQTLASYFSDKIGAKVEIRSVDIEFFNKLVLQGVYVEDLHKDTLIFAEKISTDIFDIDTRKAIVKLSNLEVTGGKFFLKYYKGEEDINLQFIIDASSSSDTTSVPGKPLSLTCKNLLLNDVAFSYHDLNKPPEPKGIDFTDLLTTHIHGALNDINILGDTITASINNLTCFEKSGFHLKSFSCLARVTPEKTTCTGLEIMTDLSVVRGDYSMSYSRFRDFQDYINSVYMDSKLSSCELSMHDLAYFASDLWGMDELVKLSGDIRGTVSKLKGKNISLSTVGRTEFKGNFNLSGLPEIENTYFEFDIKRLQTDKKSMEMIPIPPFESKAHPSLPENIAGLGLISFTGKLSGFLNDFVSYGKFSTALGALTTDINLKNNSESNVTQYSGRLETYSFQLGKFLDTESYLGAVTMKTEIEGRGLAKENVSARLTGHIESINFNKYDYHNIDVTGDVSKGLFNGKVFINDENISLKFDGSLDFTQKVPIFNFTADIKNAMIKKLNLIDRDISSKLSTNLSVHFRGNRLNDFEGTVQVFHTILEEKGKSFSMKNLELVSIANGKEKKIELHSDIADASISGIFNIEFLPQCFSQMFSRIVPAYGTKLIVLNRRDSSAIQYFEFDVKIKNSEPVTQLFLPSLKILNGSRVSGSLNSSESKFKFNLSSPELTVSGYSFHDLFADGTIDNDRLEFKSGSSKVFFSDSVSADRFLLESDFKNNSSDFHFQLANTDSSLHKANIAGKVQFSENTISVYFKPSELFVNREGWNISSESTIVLDSTSVTVRNFRIENQTQKISADGKISTQNMADFGSDNLKITIHSFDLSSLDWYLNPQLVDLGGILNGTTVLSGKISQPSFTGNINASNFSFNEDTLGTASVNASYELNKPFIGIVSSFGKDSVKTFSVNGQYKLDNPDNCLNLDVSFSNTYLQKFAKYFDDYAKDLKGIASGNLHVTGNFSKPILEGKIQLQKTSFTVEYLNTNYNLSDEIRFTPNSIEFDKITLNDKFGKTALATGVLRHKYFKDFEFDVAISPKNFLILNTNSSMNEMYYGSAFASGLVTVKGPVSSLVMNVAVKSEKGTQIYIPLSGSGEVSQHSFITFISHDTLSSFKNTYKTELNGFALKMDLEVTTDADVQIIFDSKIGDVIKGKGSGNLKMDINPNGDFFMSGEYLIDQGDYLFTLKNVINKKFSIEKGGTIRWNGDPYAADINLKAVYKLKAALSDMLPFEAEAELEEGLSTLKKRRPVECWLEMSGKLMNPTINFDIQVPDLASEQNGYADKVKYYTSTEEQKTRQVMSLLVVRRFYTPEEESSTLAQNNGSKDAGGSSVGSNSKELLSNQLNNWVSQVSNKFDVGVAVNDDEFGATLGKHFLNDRVLVDGSVKYASGQTSTTNIVGDVNAEVMISKDGKFRLKTFYKSNSGNVIGNSDEKGGAGLVYKTEFDNLKEFRIRKQLARVKKKFRKVKPEDKLPEAEPDKE